MARSLQGSLGQPYPHRAKQCRDDADVRVFCVTRNCLVARVMMYFSLSIIRSPSPAAQIRIVDAPACRTKEIITSIHGRPLHLHLHLHIPHTPLSSAPPPPNPSPRAFTLTDATNSIFWKQYDLYISAVACMYYFTLFLRLSHVQEPDVVVHANVRYSIARQRCFLNTNEIIYIST